MEEIRIFCENDGAYHKVAPGTDLHALSDMTARSVYDDKSGTELPVLAALVDNRLKELEFKIMMPHTIRFIGYNHPDGRRTYVRSLCFVLRNAVKEEIERLKCKMQEIISRDLPFRKIKMTFDEVQKIFMDSGQDDKAQLLSSLGHYTYSVYILDKEVDTFYGPLVPSTGYLQVFDLMGFSNGFCLQFPAEGNVGKVMPRTGARFSV